MLKFRRIYFIVTKLTYKCVTNKNEIITGIARKNVCLTSGCIILAFKMVSAKSACYSFIFQFPNIFSPVQLRNDHILHRKYSSHETQIIDNSVSNLHYAWQPATDHRQVAVISGQYF